MSFSATILMISTLWFFVIVDFFSFFRINIQYKTRKIQRNPIKLELVTIRMWRCVIRASISLVLTGMLLLDVLFVDIAWLGITILGGYIGYITNALVTICVLKVFVPAMKPLIADSTVGIVDDLMAKGDMSNMIIGKGNSMARKGGVLSAVGGYFLSGRLFATVLAGLVGFFGAKKIENKIESFANKQVQRITTASKDIVRKEILSMKNIAISNMMDGMMGAFLIIVELLGFVLGMAVAFLFIGI